MADRQDDTREKEGQPHSRMRKWLWSWGVLVALLVAALGIAYYWFFMYGRVDTNDAYVKAHSAMISSRVWGTVVEVCVDNDDEVKEGQVLLRLDARDYQNAVDGAQAILNRRQADVDKAEVRHNH